MATIDYYTDNKIIFDAVISDVISTYNKSYSFVGLSREAIDKIVNDAIKICKNDIKNDDIKIRILDIFCSNIRIIMRSIDPYELMNAYINKKMSLSKKYNSSLRKINQLHNFIKTNNINWDPANIEKLVSNNEVISGLLAVIVEAKKDVIESKPLELIFDNSDFLSLLVSVYCSLNSIRVYEEENDKDLELLDNYIEKKDDDASVTHNNDAEDTYIGINGFQLFMSQLPKDIFTIDKERQHFEMYQALAKPNSAFLWAKEVKKTGSLIDGFELRADKIINSESGIKTTIESAKEWANSQKLVLGDSNLELIAMTESLCDYDKAFSWANGVLNAKKSKDDFKEWAHNIIDSGEKITDARKWVKEQIVTHNLRLVAKLAFARRGRGILLDDLFQLGSMGLLKAIDKFDLSRNTKFSTIASWWILQAIDRDIANSARTIRIPVYVIEKLKKLYVTIDRLSKANGGVTPTITELAEELGTTEDEVLKLFEYEKSKPASLNSYVGDDDTELGAFVPSTADIQKDIFLKELGPLLEQAFVVGGLTKREIYVLKLRHGLIDGRIHTLEEIGHMLPKAKRQPRDGDHVTREGIRLIEAKAIKKLKKTAVRRLLEDYIPEERSDRPIVHSVTGTENDQTLIIKKDSSEQSVDFNTPEFKNANGTDKNFFVRTISSGICKIPYNTKEERTLIEERILYILNTKFLYEKNIRVWDSLFDVYGSDLKTGTGVFDFDSSDFIEKRILPIVRTELHDTDWDNVTILDEHKVIPNAGKMVKNKIPSTDKRTLLQNESPKYDEPPKYVSYVGVMRAGQGTGNATAKPYDFLGYIRGRTHGVHLKTVLSVVQALPQDKQKIYYNLVNKTTLSKEEFALLDEIVAIILNSSKSEKADSGSSMINKTSNGTASSQFDGGTDKAKKRTLGITNIRSFKNSNGTDKSFFVRMVRSGVLDSSIDLNVIEERILYILNTKFPYDKNVRIWNALFDMYGSDLKSGDGNFSSDSSRIVEKMVISKVRKSLHNTDWSKTVITDEYRVIPNNDVMTKPKVRRLIPTTNDDEIKGEPDVLTTNEWGLSRAGEKLDDATQEEVSGALSILSDSHQGDRHNGINFEKKTDSIIGTTVAIKSTEEYAFDYIKEQIPDITLVELDSLLNSVQVKTRNVYTRIEKQDRRLSDKDKKELDGLVNEILAIRKTKIGKTVDKDNKFDFDYLEYIGVSLPDVTLEEIKVALDLLPLDIRQKFINKTAGVNVEELDELVRIITNMRGPDKRVVIDNGNLACEYIKSKIPGLTDKVLYATLCEINWKKASAYVRINNISRLTSNDERTLDNVVEALEQLGFEKKSEVDNYFDYLGYVRSKIPNATFKEVNEELLLLPVNVSRKIKSIKALNDDGRVALDNLIERVKKRRRLYVKKKNDECDAFKYIRDRIPDITHKELLDVLSKVRRRNVIKTYERLSKAVVLTTSDKYLLNKIVNDVKTSREEERIRATLPGEEGSKAFRYIQERISDITSEELNDVFNYVSGDGRRVTTVGTRRAYDRLIKLEYLSFHDKEVLDNLVSTVMQVRKKKNTNSNMYQLKIPFAYIQNQIYDVRQKEIDEALSLLSSLEREKYESINKLGEEEKQFLDAIIDSIKKARKSKGIKAEQESVVFKYIKERVVGLKQDEIDEALLLLSSLEREKYESINELGVEEIKTLDVLIRCINANRDVKKIRIRETNNAAYKYISERITNITLEELYVVLGQMNAKTRNGYAIRSLLPLDAHLDARNEALLVKIVDAINDFRKRNGTDGYVPKMKKYFDYLWYIKSQIKDVSLDEIDMAISELESNMLFVFNKTYRSSEMRQLKINDLITIDELLDTIVTIIKNNRLGIDKPKIKGKMNPELSFYDYMARRLRTNNNSNFRSRIDLICEYISDSDNDFLVERFGIDRNVFSGHGSYTEIEDKVKHDTDARILKTIQDYYQQSHLLDDKIRCSTFYGYVAYKLNYPENVEHDFDFKRKIKMVLLTFDEEDVKYIKEIYGDNLEKICKVPSDPERLNRLMIRIKDKFFEDNPDAERYETVDNSSKKPFNQYFANLLEITLTPDVEADFDKIFITFPSNKRELADLYWGPDHNVYQRSSRWNHKNNAGELVNFIYVFRSKYETLFKEKKVRAAYNKGLVPFVNALVGNKIEIDIKKLEYVILKKINHKLKCEFIAAFGHDLSLSYPVDDETYDSLVMIIPRQIKNAYMEVSDSEVSEYFAKNESVMDETAKVINLDSNGNISNLGLLLVSSIGNTIRKMNIYELVNVIGLSHEEASIVSYALNMPYNFDIAEVSKKIEKSESDIRKALAKLLSKVRDGIITTLGTEQENVTKEIIDLNDGKVRIFPSLYNR